MMPISIRALRPSYPAFAGEVSGIDITQPIGFAVSAAQQEWKRLGWQILDGDLARRRILWIWCAAIWPTCRRRNASNSKAKN